MLKIKRFTSYFVIMLTIIVNIYGETTTSTVYEKTVSTGVTTEEIQAAVGVIKTIQDPVKINNQDMVQNEEILRYRERNFLNEKKSAVITTSGNAINVTRSSIETSGNTEALFMKYFNEYSKVERNLKIFGADVLRNSIGSYSPQIGKNYILGIGDTINIKIWDDYNISKNMVLTQAIGNGGDIYIPNSGVINVVGKTIAKAERDVLDISRQKSSSFNIDISLARMRNITVNVLGEVALPGVVSVPAESNIMDAIAKAGGITDNASIRSIIVKTKIEDKSIDVYDFLLGKKGTDSFRVYDGETVFVSSGAKQVSIFGGVNSPGIYEVKNEQTFDELIKLAGGIKTTADTKEIVVNYIENRSIKSRQIKQINDAVGNLVITEINVGEIDKESINSAVVLGKIVKPGSYEVTKSMKARDLILVAGGTTKDSYSEYMTLLKKNSDNSYSIMGFNINRDNPEIGPRDILTVYSRDDINEKSVVTVKGNVQKPGIYEIYDGARLKEAVIGSYGLNNEARTYMEKATVLRISDGRKPEIISVNLEKALSGDLEHNIRLKKNDIIEIYKYDDVFVPDDIFVYGEVNSPGRYTYYSGTTISDAVFLAKGIKAGGDTNIEILRRTDKGLEKKIIDYRIVSDFQLKPNDQIYVRKNKAWEEVKTVKIGGYVNNPGDYAVSDGETLNSLIERAGGFKAGAFPEAIEFRRIETAVQSIREMNLEKGLIADAELMQTTKIKVVNVKYNKKNKNYDGEIILKDKDEIYIPEFRNQVKVIGEVYNPGYVIYNNGSVNNYITMAGGYKEEAREGKVFVLDANGSAKKSFLWFGVKIEPGDTIVVPRDIRENGDFNNAVAVVRTVSEIILTGIMLYNIWE